MNGSNKDDEKPSENREARARATDREPSEPEIAPPKDANDHRETSEGGYGWGV